MAKVRYIQKVLADVDKCITSAHESYQTTRNKVQVAAVAVLLHAYNHGDYSKANTLIEGLQGLNQAALVEFFVQFGGFTVSEDETGFTGWSGKDHLNDNFQAAKDTMWWDLKVQKPWMGFNLNAAIQLVIANADKATARASKNEELVDLVDINAEQLAALKALAA